MSIFTQIINKDLPGHFLWRDPSCVVFLSINPVTPGHSLVVPIREVDHWLDLDASEIQHLSVVAHHIGAALQEVYNPERVGMMIAGFEIPHTHLHVICINSMADMDLIHSKSVETDELEQAAKSIRQSLATHGHEFIAES